MTVDDEAMLVDNGGMGCAAEKGYLMFSGKEGTEERANGTGAKDENS
jgi:hypothetical protein